MTVPLSFAEQGDAGVTGRKIIVDTYGGWGAHGGGAFSGKDFSKVDRSAAYAARWVAKSLVKAKLCRRVLVQVSAELHPETHEGWGRLKRWHNVLIKPSLSPRLCVLQVSYAIGVAHPLSISLFTYGSSEKTETELLHIVNKNFDLRPGVIVR